MRAVFSETYGGPDSLQFGEQPRPQATNGGVLVRVQAAGVGLWDVAMMQGRFRSPLPLIPSSEVAGEVVEADHAGRFQVGDRVFGSLALAGGGAAEYVVIPADRVVAMSPQLSFVEAAALVIGGGTAYEGLIDRGQLQAGETVLITAAAGGVGTVAVQIAAATGAKVLAVASAHDSAYLTNPGVQHVFDYHDADWPKHLRAVAPDGVDLLFDATRTDTLAKALTTVKQSGRAILIAGQPEHLPAGVTGGFFAATVNAARLNALNTLVDSGKLKAEIRGTVPLETAQIAFAKVADGHGRGKIVLVMDQDAGRPASAAA